MTGHWVIGDHSGVAIPVAPHGIRVGGAGFLTAAMRRSGTLGLDNHVARVTQCDEVGGGSTGRKMLMSVEYAAPDARLPTELFVKLSRDLDDPARDRGRTQMEPEVRFAALAQAPGFPITVPTTMFADYHRGTGTGILITERIAFGRNGIEPQYHKCLDYEMPEPVEHYRAVVTAIARLAGTHRAGVLPAELASTFPVDLQAATVGERPPLTADKLHRKLIRLTEFAQSHPKMLPPNVCEPAFLSALAEQAPRVLTAEPATWHRLATDSDHIALCHWNANVDNAWFWRDADGVLRCGLMDWGCVSQLNVAMALWGALSAAETSLWDRHFDELVQLFVTEAHRCGGPAMNAERLRDHTLLYAVMMGVVWLLDVPALIRQRFGDGARSMTRFDDGIRDDESVRAPLQMFTNILNLWQTHDVGRLLETVEHR